MGKCFSHRKLPLKVFQGFWLSLQNSEENVWSIIYKDFVYIQSVGKNVSSNLILIAAVKQKD